MMRTRVKRSCVPRHVCYCDCKNHRKGIHGANQITSRYDTNTTWAARNNSCNVARALHPDHYKTASDTEDSDHICAYGARPKHCLEDNDCYCNQKPVKPSILPRPRTCIITEDCESRPPPSLKVDNINARCYKITPCQSPRQPLSTRLKKMREENIQRERDKHQCLRFTRDRENYEHLRGVINEEYTKSIKQYEEEERKALSSCRCPVKARHSVQAVPNRKENTYKYPTGDVSTKRNLSQQGRSKSPTGDVSPNRNLSQEGRSFNRRDEMSKSASGSKPISSNGIDHLVTGPATRKPDQSSKLHTSNGNEKREDFVEQEDSPGNAKTPSFDDLETSTPNRASLQGEIGPTEGPQRDSHTNHIYFAPKNTYEHSHMNEAFKDLSDAKDADSSSERPSQSTSSSYEGDRWKQFRKTHYSDTHSMEAFWGSAPDHTCVHKFELDERLFPVAVNGDVYGTSRCVICNKIMPVEKTVFKDQRLDKKTIPNYYQYGRKPTRVNMGAEGVKIVLHLKEKDAYLIKDWCRKAKKPVYTNTLALRFQKGAF